MKQLMDAVFYLHSDLIRVAHCDIKLDNIMVDRQLNLLLYDFGFAMFGKLNSLTAGRGTKQYAAPEILESKTYDGRKTDIFSAGVVLFILAVPVFPFREATEDSKTYSLLI